MPHNPHADFTPTLAGYSGITPFRFWCQTALPLTYDDSLSYYELLNKVVTYLNNTITDLTNVEDNTSELADAYVQLQNYVNNYFDDIDIEAELRNVLDGMAEDGTLDALLDPLVANRLPDVVEDQISGVVANQIDGAVEGQIGDVVEEQLPDVVENQLPAVVDEKIDAVVAGQIDGAVAGQIDESVEEQLPAVVESSVPGEVSDWLTENVDPVGSAVVVDSSLTISGAAADAKVTGDEVSDLKEHIDKIAVINLFDSTDDSYIADAYIDGSGNQVNNVGYFVSNHIPCEGGGKTYVCTYTIAAGLTPVRYYRADGVRLGNVTGILSDDNKHLTFTIPVSANISYFTVNGRTSYTEFMIVEGSEYPAVYVPHIGLAKGVILGNNDDYNSLAHNLSTQIDNLQKIIKEKKQNATAYVSGNAISWYISGDTCFLTINNTIVVRTNYGTTSNNIIAQISVSDLLDTVENAGFTVTDGVISGRSFAIVFDFDDNTLKALSPTNKEIFDNTLILFVHHYASWTAGALLDAANNLYQKEMQAEIDEVKQSVETIIPSLPNYLENEVDTCFSELVSTCDEKTLVIAFTTDNHYGASNGMNFPTTANSIKSINDKFPIDFVVDGGDLINGDKTKAEDITNLSNAVRMLLDTGKPAYTLIGNHDDGSFTNTELPLLSKGELYALMERHSGIDLDYIDSSEHYGYKDYEQYNLRIIFLDSMYGNNGHDNGEWGYSDDELLWLTNTALDTTKQVVLFSHMGFTKEFSAYNYQVHNGAEMRSAVESFIANGGTVVALFHGHTHWDFIGKYSQTNGFYEVSTGCGRVVSGPITTRTDYYPTGATMPERETGTVTQELWDIIAIQPESRSVKMIRYGAGSDRTFTY